jgi:hypothetical protein
MSDITITFPPGLTAWFLLGQAAPFTSLLMAGLTAAYFLSRGRVRRRRWLMASLAIVGVAWLGGITFWAVLLQDRIGTAIYEARHHYQLDKATIMAGIEIPKGSWVWVDENWVLYEIDTTPDAVVSIDNAQWSGDIRLAGLGKRAVADRATVQSATLAADALIQGIPCRAGKPVEFYESEPWLAAPYDGALEFCTLARRAVVTAQIDDATGIKSTTDVACAADREIRFRAFGHRFLERCILAEAATVGRAACAGGSEIVTYGDGLEKCTSASP